MTTKNQNGKSAAESEYEIMFPSGVTVEILGKKLTIYPLPDEEYQRIARAIVRTSNLFISIAMSVATAKTEIEVTAQLLAMRGELEEPIKELIPDITAIVACALHVDHDWITQNLRFAQRLRLLRAVLEAEDIQGQLLGEFMAMGKLIKPVAAKMAAPSTSPQETSTTSSPASTSGATPKSAA